MAIGRTVPSERNNTYAPSAVSRKTAEELFETAFNSDQQQVLNNIIVDIPQPTPSGPQVPEPTASDNGKVLGVDGGEYKLVEQSVDVGYKCIENYDTTVTVTLGSDVPLFDEEVSLVGLGGVSINGGETYYPVYDNESFNWKWSADDIDFSIDGGGLFYASQSGEYAVSLYDITITSFCFTNAVYGITQTMPSSSSQPSEPVEQVVYIDVTNGTVSTDALYNIAPSIEGNKIVALREYESGGLSVQYKIYYYCQCERASATAPVTGHIFSNGYKTVRVDSATGAVTEITN